MDIFDRKGIKPMLLTEDHTPTDSSDYICELKLDGIRCLTYLSNHTDLRNKRDIPLIAAFPELSSIHTKARGKCILDGELIIPSSDGSPDFETMQACSMLTDPVRIRLASKINPAAFVAFDVLYRDGNELMHLPLMERKRLLSDVVSESSRLALSRMFDNSSALFELTVRQGLEGIVQKRKNSLYHPGKALIPAILQCSSSILLTISALGENSLVVERDAAKRAAVDLVGTSLRKCNTKSAVSSRTNCTKNQ